MEFSDSLDIHALPIDIFGYNAGLQLLGRFEIKGRIERPGSASASVAVNASSDDPGGSSFSEVYDQEFPIDLTLDLAIRVRKDAENELHLVTDLIHISVGAAAAARPGGDHALADFYNTVRLLGFQLVDANGNAVAATFTSATSGFSYVDLSAVPEPSSLALLAVGTLGLVIRAARRPGPAAGRSDGA